MEETLEQKLIESPIELPANPFLEALLTFGRDEAISGAVNVAANTLGGLFLRGSHDALLAATGLTVEKIGLFAWYFKEAFETYRTTPTDKRKSVARYAYNAFKEGLPTLVKDVLVHDPLDYLFMYGGLKAFPSTPTLMISLTSFVTAVIGASLLDVSYNELRYHLLDRRLSRSGFDHESYIEARFILPKEKDREHVLADMEHRFNLSGGQEWEYKDKYFPTVAPVLNGRKPKLRLRERTRGEEAVRTCQLVYTRSKENASKSGFLSRPVPEQFRYFAARKDKFYRLLEIPMPATIGSIPFASSRCILEKYLDKSEPLPHEISFNRTYVHDHELLVSVDRINSERSFYVLELKVRNNTDLLRQAMRYVMMEYSPLQTTHSKPGLIRLNGS